MKVLEAMKNIVKKVMRDNLSSGAPCKKWTYFRTKVSIRGYKKATGTGDLKNKSLSQTF